ncbi:DEAD/DEAH box helicase family protein [Candidatus Poseidoniaceae archaeon]|nr:DEAD/DEAH box helicase family protein [Candidatus Poseidoniaceae archaeon]
MVAEIHDVLKQGPYSNWNELHEQISQIDESTTAKGDAFEQFSYFYLLYHKDIYEIEEIWCDKVPNREIPDYFKDQKGKYRIGAGKDIDHGTDLVAQLKGFEEPHEAYQAKFRSDYSTHPSSHELSTFWNDSVRFERRRIITSSDTVANTDKNTDYFDNAAHHIYRGDFLNISDPEDFFAKLHEWANDQEKVPERTLYEPLDHQEEMIKDVVAGFVKLKKKQDQRGKLIAACGTGKTLAALWITEHSDLDISNLLFLAPTIELTAQTFREWAMQHKEEFDFLIICSDDDAGNVGEDNSDIPVSDLGIRVTTDVHEILGFLDMKSDKRKYVFSTYQSSDRIREAMELTTAFKSFDLIIFDEAHRTASKTFDPKGGMQVAIDNTKIDSKRRLFMTATERIQTPRVKKYLETAGKDYFSMDDEDKYGTTFHSLTFGKAIKQKIIADYRIILAGCDYQGEDEDVILDAIVEVNGISKPLTYLEVYQALFVSKLIDEGTISKVLTFQNTVARAQAFSYLLRTINGVSDINIDAIWGEEGIASRREKKSQFGLAKKAVLSNVRCLSEGVDLPMIDSVVFCDDRSSPIDLIQAVGRALRMKKGEDKVATILIPVPIPSDTKTLDDVDWDNVPGMTTFHEILQALRDQDGILNEEIEEIHVQSTKSTLGKKRSSGSAKTQGKILVIPPPSLKINLHDMWDKIGIRISAANFRKKGEKSIFVFEKPGDRKSKHKSKFALFGNYNIQNGMKNECLEVIAQLSVDRKPILKSTLKTYASSEGNNTASMLISIGAVKEIDRNTVVITSLGLRLKSHPEQWDDVVINQALIFSKNGILPYRLILNILSEYRFLNYHEYLLGISQIEVIGILPDFEKMHSTITYLRKNYPNGLGGIPDGRHEETIAELESNGIAINVETKDIWSSGTTQRNYWGYLRSCMEVLPFISTKNDPDKGLIIYLKSKEALKELKISLIDSSKALGKEYGSASSWWYTSPEEEDDDDDYPF